MSVVYVLVGPKGSRKSHVGRLLETEFGIKISISSRQMRLIDYGYVK